MQDNLLSNEQRRFYTVQHPQELTGVEARRQIDLLIKRKSGESSDSEHNWKDIMVIGELKASHNDGVKKPLVQLARYARDLFACQPTRRFLHAFTICGSRMEVWVFDRAGCYSPGPFNIHEHPKRFIRVLTGYIMMSEDELGIDTFIRRDGDSHLIHLEDEEGSRTEKLQLFPEPLTRQRAIVSRATCCFLAKHPDSDDYGYVAKFSWPCSKRKPESDFLELAKSRGVQGIARLVGHYDITSVGDIRSGLTFAKRYSFNSLASTVSSFSQTISQSQRPVSKHHSIAENSTERPKKRKLVGEDPIAKRRKSNTSRQSGLKNEVTYLVGQSRETSPVDSSDGLFDDRVFRCLVISPAGRPIYKYKSPIELLEALRDAIKAHQSLYSKGNILHRDISENNIIITDPTKTGFSGMLIDLDLAQELGSARSGARCRTGTLAFMAIEVLRGVDHTYRHDLESFFYVLLWQCISRGWDFVARQNPTNRRVLTHWYTGTFEDIASIKTGNMVKIMFEYILKEIPEELSGMKFLCRELRSILFPIKEGALFIGTPPDPNSLYGPIVDAFDRAIGRIKTQEPAVISSD